jgi:hypothetical protein
MPSVWSLAQVVAFVTFALTSCSDLMGQTENQLEQRYNRPNAFEVRPGVNAYPTFAADGNVCRMVIAKYPKVDSKSADTNTTIPPALVKEIENELAPEDERGRELSPYLSPDSFVMGGASLIKKDYENVSIGVYGSGGDAYAIVITWRYHTCWK